MLEADNYNYTARAIIFIAPEGGGVRLLLAFNGAFKNDRKLGRRDYE